MWASFEAVQQDPKREAESDTSGQEVSDKGENPGPLSPHALYCNRNEGVYHHGYRDSVRDAAEMHAGHIALKPFHPPQTFPDFRCKESYQYVQDQWNVPVDAGYIG